MRNKYRSEHWRSVFWVFWLTLLSFTQLQAQAVQPPVIQWQQLTEPGSGGEVRLAKANDGGYVVLSSWVGRLVRLSATGEIKWQVRIPTSSSFKDVIYKSTGLVATKDGGFIVLAQDDSGWYLTKVDANGNGIWAKVFDSFEPKGNFQRIKKHLIQTADGSLLVAGYTSFPRFPTQATVEKFDQDGNYVWSHTYRYDGYDVYVRETTVATRIVEVSGGNYVVTGATIGDDTQKYPQRAWAAKLDRDGSVLWQQRYENRLLLDDIAVSPYTDQLYVASGVNNLNSAITNSLNIHAEGNDGGGYYQPGRVVGSNSAIASIKATNGLPAYHTLLDVSDQNSGDFRINALTTNNELLWTKTIGGSGEERAYAILATDDGGYLVAGTTTSTDGDVQGKTDNQVATWLVKLGPASPPNALTLTQPTYNCQTGAITFNTSGGDGSPITYTAPGITRAALTDNFGAVEQGLRNDPKPILIQATQSGRTVSYTFDFGAYCNNPKPPSSSTLVLVAPTYNCQTGAITFNTAGGDGSPITYTAPGITRAALTDNFGTVERELRNDPKPILIQATQSGRTVSYTFDFGAYCNNPKPPTSSTLVLVAPTYNCQTGAITFNTTGGDGSPIEFRAAGITDWTTNPNQFVDKESRTANDVQPFMLMARQSGYQVSYSWDLKAACGRARVGVDEVGSGLSLRVLGNPAGEQLRVLIEGVEGEAVELELSDVNGRLVERRRLESSGAHEEHVFSLEKSGSKLLLLRAATTQQSKTVRIMKQ